MLKRTVCSSLGAFAFACSTVAADTIEVHPRGRIHVDLASHGADQRDLGEKFLLRRARIGLRGSVADDWSFQIEYDFAGNDTTAKNVYLRYGGWRRGAVTIGHFNALFGLEGSTSSNEITFIERSLPATTFGPPRGIGLGLEGGGDRWRYSLMGFGQLAGAEGRDSDASDAGLGIGGRLAFSPVRRHRGLLHLGLAALTREPADSDAGTVRFRTGPESRPTGVSLVDTGVLDNVDRITQFGAELAWQTGSFSMQGEWMQADVRRKAGDADVDFAGWYASASYVLTGESRGYGEGRFRGVIPERVLGAWEVTARASHIDLNDGPVTGGEETNYTLGLNWYVHRNVRFMANLVRVASERDMVVDQGLVTVRDDPTIFLMRTQVSF